jgi:hypothetical protein
MPTVCLVDNCNNPHLAKGLCSMHYQRFKRTGDPRGLVHIGVAAAYLDDVVLKHKDNACLLWPHGRNSSGYAMVHLDGLWQRVSRIVCSSTYGPQPPDKPEVAHWCGNPLCVAPIHLRWASRQENEKDKDRHGTRVRGSRHGRSKLTEAEVLAIRAQPHRRSKELAAEFGITDSMVCIIRRRSGWTHI